MRGPWPGPFARRRWRQASYRASRLQIQECPTKGGFKCLYSRFRSSPSIRSWSRLWRCPRASWNTPIYGPGSFGWRYKFHQRRVFANRYVCVCIGPLGDLFQVILILELVICVLASSVWWFVCAYSLKHKNKMFLLKKIGYLYYFLMRSQITK